MTTYDKLELNLLKQEIVRSEMDSITKTIAQIMATKRALEKHRNKLIARMMELTSEEIKLEEEQQSINFNQKFNENS